MADDSAQVDEAAEAAEKQPTQRVRRRASRAAGPAKLESGLESSESSGGSDAEATEATEAAEAAEAAEGARGAKGAAKVKSGKSGKSGKTAKSAKSAKSARSARSGTAPAKKLTSVRPPPRRQPHRVLVGWISFAIALALIGVLAAGLAFLVVQQRHADAQQGRQQRFVDAASQMVVNMYSYRQDNIDDSVNRFVNSTSGPLRGTLSRNNAVEMIKDLYRRTNATSEAIITGAALEGIDTVEDNASVLVSVRVTVSNPEGVNEPSKPYRLRIIVHEDDAGKMTFYDLKYPDGGN